MYDLFFKWATLFLRKIKKIIASAFLIMVWVMNLVVVFKSSKEITINNKE